MGYMFFFFLLYGLNDSRRFSQGVTLNGWKEQLLHHDFGPEDVHFHFTNVSSN